MSNSINAQTGRLNASTATLADLESFADANKQMVIVGKQYTPGVITLVAKDPTKLAGNFSF